MKELIKKKIKDIKNIRFLSYLVLFSSIVFFVLFFLLFFIYANDIFVLIIGILFWIVLFLWLVSEVILIIQLLIYKDEKETNSTLRLIAAILMIFISFIASILSIVWSKREQEYHEKKLFSLDTNKTEINNSNGNDTNSINNV